MEFQADFWAINLMLISYLSNVNLLTGGWRKLHNEELHDLNSSPNNTVLKISNERGWFSMFMCI
jgi:hypothetical protein